MLPVALFITFTINPAVRALIWLNQTCLTVMCKTTMGIKHKFRTVTTNIWLFLCSQVSDLSCLRDWMCTAKVFFMSFVPFFFFYVSCCSPLILGAPRNLPHEPFTIIQCASSSFFLNFHLMPHCIHAHSAEFVPCFHYMVRLANCFWSQVLVFICFTQQIVPFNCTIQTQP